MQSFNLLNLSSPSAAAPQESVGKGLKGGLGGLVQAVDSKGAPDDSNGFAPVLHDLLMQAQQAGVDTSDPAAVRQFLSQELMSEFEAYLQDQGLDSASLLDMNGQELADSLEQAGIRLPPGRQAALIEQWDESSESGAKLAFLAAIVKPEMAAGGQGKAVDMAAHDLNPESHAHDARAGSDDNESVELALHNSWTVPLTAQRGEGRAEFGQAEQQQGASAWLLNDELHAKIKVSGSTASGFSAQTGAVLAGESGLMPRQGGDTSAWQMMTSQQNTLGQYTAAPLTSESDTLFRTQLDAASLTLAAEGAEGADELLQDKSSGLTRGIDLQSRQTAATARPYTTAVNVPVGDPQWNDQVGQKIVWLTGRQIQSAEIHVNPAELGPVEVKISVSNDQATVSFNAQHASVRELLEANVHRLREMMEANGVNLGEVNVGNGDADAQYASEHGESAGGRAGSEDGDGHSDSDDNEMLVRKESDRLIDFYA